MTSGGLWSWASRSRSCDDQVPPSTDNGFSYPSVMHCPKDKSVLSSNWEYPRFHQVPSISQGTDMSSSLEQTRVSFGEVKQEVRGPGLAASAVFSLKAAATNRFLNKLGGSSGEDMEVSSGSNQQDQQAASNLLASDYRHDVTFGEQRPLAPREECEQPQPFSGATRIRLQRHLSGDYGPKSEAEISTLGALAVQHASGTPIPPGVSSFCAINPLYYPRVNLAENLGLDGQVPESDGSLPGSPSSFRKRSGFENDEFGSDRALKFLRRSAESAEQLDMGRIWGRQASFPATRSNFYEEWRKDESGASSLNESPLLERSLSADLTPRPRSASPRLRRGEPLSNLEQRVSPAKPRGEPNPNQDLNPRQVSSGATIQSFVVHSANEVAYVSARLPGNWASTLSFLGPQKVPTFEADSPLVRKSYPVQTATKVPSEKQPPSTIEASSEAEAPRAGTLTSQASLSHWAGLTLDLACLEDESGAMSPFQLSASNFSDTPSTTPGFSDGRVAEDAFLSNRRETTCLPKKRSLENEPGILREKGVSTESAEKEVVSPTTRAAADVTLWLGVLREGIKRQGSWTGVKTDVLKQLAEATNESEAYVQSVKREGGLNLMIKLLKAEDEQIVEAASEIISNCNGQFQAKPTIKAFDFPGGLSVKVRELPFAENGLGCKVWKAAVLMGDKLVGDPSLVARKRVLELGAGCGLCGFVATKLGAAEVTLTDNNIPLLTSLRGSVQSLLCTMTPPSKQTATLLSSQEPVNQALNQRGDLTPSTREETRVGLGAPHDMHFVQNGCGLAMCGLSYLSKVPKAMGLGKLIPTAFGVHQIGVEGPDLSKPSGLRLSKPNVPDGGPDETRRTVLLQSQPQSPTSAFHSLSFHSPPMGPQLPPLMVSPVTELPSRAGEWNSHYEDARVLGKEMCVRIRYLDWEEENELLVDELGGHVRTGSDEKLDALVCPPRLEQYDTFDVILGSDCLYNASAIESLSAVIKRRMAWPNGRCLLTSAVRDEVMFDDFRKRLEGRGLKVALTKLDEESVASGGLDAGGTFHNADYYAGGFVLVEVSHLRGSPCDCVC